MLHPHTSPTKVLIGLSGNVLSSVVAALLKHQGFQVVGIHFKLDEESQAEAERISQKLGISLIVEDVHDLYNNVVVDHVVHQVLANRMPEPMVHAHQRILIERLSAKAAEMNCAKIATGHAARVALDPSTGLTRLLRAADRELDQSHVLFGLEAKDLRQFILPVGDLGGAAMERLAIELELDPQKLMNRRPGFGAIPESLFLEIAEPRIPPSMKLTGQIKTAEGTVIGDHQGLYRFTRGQSKGLPLAREKQGQLVVVEMDSSNQTLILGKDEQLMSQEVLVSEVNWIQPTDPIKSLQCEARLNESVLARCRVTEFEHRYVHVELKEPQRNIVPGQAIVFYAGDEVLGGGFAL